MQTTLVMKYIIDGIDTGYCVNSVGEMFTENRTAHCWSLYKGAKGKNGLVYRRDRLSSHFKSINKEGSITQQELVDYYESMLSKTTPFEIHYINRAWKPRERTSTPKGRVVKQVLPVVDLIKPKMLLLEGKPTNLYVQKDGYLCFWIKKELRIIAPYNGTKNHYYTVSNLAPKEPLLRTTKDPIVQSGRIYVEELKEWYSSDASYGLPPSNNNHNAKPTATPTTGTDSAKPPIIALIDTVAHVFKDVPALHKYLLDYDVTTLKQPTIALYTHKGTVTVEKPTSVNSINNLKTLPLLDTACSANKIVVFVNNMLCQMVNNKEEGYEVLRNMSITSPIKAKMFMNNMDKVVATMDVAPPSTGNKIWFNVAGE